MKRLQIRKTSSVSWGVFEEFKHSPIVKFETELECYQWCNSRGYLVV